MREVLLAVVEQESKKGNDASLQQNVVLNEAAKMLSIGKHGGEHAREVALLSDWHELFRTGMLAWGYNLSNPNPPFFHLTPRGEQALVSLTRNPANPAGYFRYLVSKTHVGQVPLAYITEAVHCYTNGLFKAAAVMVGAASEALILDVRFVVVARLQYFDEPVPSALNDWRIKPVTDGIGDYCESHIDRKTHRALFDRFETYWTAFAGQVRAVRNDAGHPTSIER
jgi:hypothetical protein